MKAIIITAIIATALSGCATTSQYTTTDAMTLFMGLVALKASGVVDDGSRDIKNWNNQYYQTINAEMSNRSW